MEEEILTLPDSFFNYITLWKAKNHLSLLFIYFAKLFILDICWNPGYLSDKNQSVSLLLKKRSTSDHCP